MDKEWDTLRAIIDEIAGECTTPVLQPAHRRRFWKRLGLCANIQHSCTEHNLIPAFLGAMRTASDDDAAVVEFFLQCNADPNTRDKRTGLAPLELAAKNNTPAVVSVLARCHRTDPTGINPLFYAAHFGSLDALRVLINPLGAPVQPCETMDGRTAVHEVVDEPAVLGDLLAYVERTSPGMACAADSDGATPLHSACWRRAPLASAEMLLAAGCRPDTSARWMCADMTPFHMAAERCLGDVVLLFLNNGWPPPPPDEVSGRTLFHLMACSDTVRGDMTEACRRLVGAGVDPLARLSVAGAPTALELARKRGAPIVAVFESLL